MIGIDYVAIGLAYFLLAAVMCKWLEGMFVSPATVFFGIFFVHAYVDPLFRLGSVHLNLANFDVMSTMVIGANGLLIAGYWLVMVANPAKRKYQNRIDPVFGPSSFYLVALLTISVFLLLFVIMAKLGLFSASRGGLRHDGGYGTAKAMEYFFYSMIPALWLSMFTDRIGQQPLRWVLVGAVLGGALLYTMLTFGRMFAFFNVLTCFLIYHTRVQRMKLRHVALVGGGLVMVTLVALLRGLGVGFTDLRFEQIATLASGGGLGVLAVLQSLLTAVPGQEVFSNTITLIDERDGFRYGSTYVQALTGVFIPNTLTGLEQQQPAGWYHQTYAPSVLNHGFDFSMFAEAYMNFGKGGMFVFFFVGMFLATVSNLLRLSRNPVVIIWASMMIVNLVVSLRNDSTPLVTRAVYFIVPLIAMRFAMRMLLRPTPQRPGPSAA